MLLFLGRVLLDRELLGGREEPATQLPKIGHPAHIFHIDADFLIADDGHQRRLPRLAGVEADRVGVRRRIQKGFAEIVAAVRDLAGRHPGIRGKHEAKQRPTYDESPSQLGPDKTIRLLPLRVGEQRQHLTLDFVRGSQGERPDVRFPRRQLRRFFERLPLRTDSIGWRSLLHRH